MNLLVERMTFGLDKGISIEIIGLEDFEIFFELDAGILVDSL